MSETERDASDNTTRDRVTLRLSSGAQAALGAIKQAYGLTSDAEALRIAIGTERRMAEAFLRDEQVLVADKDRRNIRELVFSHWQTGKR